MPHKWSVRASDLKKMMMDTRHLLKVKVDDDRLQVEVKDLKKEFKRKIKKNISNKDKQQFNKIEELAKGNNNKQFWKEV